VTLRWMWAKPRCAPNPADTPYIVPLSLNVRCRMLFLIDWCGCPRESVGTSEGLSWPMLCACESPPGPFRPNAFTEGGWWWLWNRWDRINSEGHDGTAGRSGIGSILKVLTAPQGGAARGSEAAATPPESKRQKTTNGSRTAKVQFQTFCSQDLVREGDGVEHKGKRGTVKWWEEGKAWAIQETVGGKEGALIVDPLIWMCGTEEDAYPKDDNKAVQIKARSAVDRKKRSILFSRGEKKWYPWAPKPKPAAVPAAVPASGSPATEGDAAQVCPPPPGCSGLRPLEGTGAFLRWFLSQWEPAPECRDTSGTHSATRRSRLDVPGPRR